MENSKSIGLSLLALAVILSTSLYAKITLEESLEESLSTSPYEGYKCSYHLEKEAIQHMSRDDQSALITWKKKLDNICQEMIKKGVKNQNKDLIPSVLMSLNLSKDQKMEIFKIKEEVKNDSPLLTDAFTEFHLLWKRIELLKTPLLTDAFTESEFDRRTFVEVLKLKEKNEIEDRAEMMEKVYKILTPKQKKQFKVLLDLKEGNDMGNLHP